MLILQLSQKFTLVKIRHFANSLKCILSERRNLINLEKSFLWSGNTSGYIFIVNNETFFTREFLSFKSQGMRFHENLKFAIFVISILLQLNVNIYKNFVGNLQIKFCMNLSDENSFGANVSQCSIVTVLQVFCLVA